MLLCGVKCPRPGTCKSELATRAPSPHGQGSARARCEESFFLEPIERCIDCSDGVVAPGSFGEISTDGKAIRVVTEAGNGEEGHEFKTAKIRCRHYSYIVKHIRIAQADVVSTACQ